MNVEDVELLLIAVYKHWLLFLKIK